MEAQTKWKLTELLKCLVSRSVEKHGVKYSKYNGDRDSKTFKGLLNIEPYSGDPIVQKKNA